MGSDPLIDIAVIEDAEELRAMLYEWLPVIEAARALHRRMNLKPQSDVHNEVAAIWAAVEALDAAEKEGA